jgi:UDP-glucose 4-epimerase
MALIIRRDYIHVSDLLRAHSGALRYLRAGGVSLTLNCGYGHGFSVREVIEIVKRLSGVGFHGRDRTAAAGRRSIDRCSFRALPHDARMEATIR